MTDYKFGIVSPRQFIEAWESQKPVVLIFIHGTGWVPYPDDLLWYGFQNIQGVDEYVKEKYVLSQTIHSFEQDNSYKYVIWRRK